MGQKYSEALNEIENLKNLNDPRTKMIEFHSGEEESLKRKHEKEALNLEINVMNQARELMLKNEQFVHAENLTLIANLNLLRTELYELKQQKQHATEQAKRMRVDLEINKQQLQDSLSKHTVLTRTITRFKEKTKALQSQLSDQSLAFSQSTQQISTDLTAVLSEQNSEHSILQRRYNLQTKELKQMKGLAQMILDQRSDIEKFFLESLECIKQEKSMGKAASDCSSFDAKAVVDISELSWEEREKVLRLIFSQMNK